MDDDAVNDRLDGMKRRAADGTRLPRAVESDPAADALLLQAARSIASTRNRRAQYFRAELFAEPAWDMLLDLFIAHLEGRQVYVSSLCIAAGVPATTALRYIQDLERNGEIISSPDNLDGRRRWLWLSEASVTAMRELLNRLPPWLSGDQPSHAVN